MKYLSRAVHNGWAHGSVHDITPCIRCPIIRWQFNKLRNTKMPTQLWLLRAVAFYCFSISAFAGQICTFSVFDTRAYWNQVVIQDSRIGINIALLGTLLCSRPLELYRFKLNIPVTQLKSNVFNNIFANTLFFEMNSTWRFTQISI